MGIRYTRREREDENDPLAISFDDVLKARWRQRERSVETVETELKITRVAVFVSGTGTNCENLIRYFADNKKIQIAMVLSNKPDAPALDKAQKLGVATEIVDKTGLNDPQVMLPLLEKYAIDFIVLAGFLPIIPNFLIDAFPRRIINLHPALLPKYGGKGMWGHHVHEAVKAASETETGMTVHFVNNVCDGGEIIAQRKCPISPDDTPDDIARKEQQLEQLYFPEIVEQVINE